MSEDTETTAGEKTEGGQMSLIAHLTELRNRLGVALLACFAVRSDAQSATSDLLWLSRQLWFQYLRS